MNIIRKIVQNSGILIFNNIADTVFNLAVSISLAKYFSQTGFGKLSFLTIFFFFLGSVDNQWIRPILVREMSREPNNRNRIMGNGIIIKTCISIFAIILFWITIWLIRPSKDIITLAFFTSISLLSASLISSYVTIFQVELKMAYFVTFNLLSKVLILFLIYIVQFLKGGLFHFYVLSITLGIVFLLQVKYFSEKILRPIFEIDFELWRKIFRESWPLGLTAFFIFIYHRLDQVLLFRLKGADSVGVYSVAVRLAEGFNIVPIALMTSVLPLMSKYYEASKNDFVMLYKLSFKYLLNFIIPIAFVISIFSEQIILLLFGKDFLSSSHALRILIWAEFFVFVGVVNNSILIAARKQIFDPIFTGASVLVNVVLNFILIPKYSFVGAAIVSLVSYSVGPIMGYFIPSTKAYSRCMLYYSFRPLCASLFMVLFIYYTRNFFWIAFLISPFMYLFTLYFIKGVDKNDVYRLN